MHPYIATEIAHSRIADLHREAEARRRAAQVNRRTLAERAASVVQPLLGARRTAADWVAARAASGRPAEPACCPA